MWTVVTPTKLFIKVTSFIICTIIVKIMICRHIFYETCWGWYRATGRCTDWWFNIKLLCCFWSHTRHFKMKNSFFRLRILYIQMQQFVCGIYVWFHSSLPKYEQLTFLTNNKLVDVAKLLSFGKPQWLEVLHWIQCIKTKWRPNRRVLVLFD